MTNEEIAYWYKFEEEVHADKYHRFQRFYLHKRLEEDDMDGVLKSLGGSQLDHTELSYGPEKIFLEKTNWGKDDYSVIQFLETIEMDSVYLKITNSIFIELE